MPVARKSPPTERFDLDHFLPYRLSLLSNTVSQGISTAYRRRFDLSVTEWRVIAILGRFPGLTASEVMSRGAMDKVAVSRAVARLLERGLLARNAQADDRRRMSLRLTADRGEPLFNEVVPQALAYEQSLLTSLTDAERDVLSGLLLKLQVAAESINRGTPS